MSLTTSLAQAGRRWRRWRMRNRAAKRARATGPRAGEVTLVVPPALVQKLPAEVQASEALRTQYLQEALRIGVTAIAQAGVSLDTCLVKNEFEDFFSKVQRHSEDSRRTLQDLLTGQITGEDSHLATLLLEHLGEQGRLARLLDDAHRRLADPAIKLSLPNTIGDLVSTALQDEHTHVSNLVNASDPSSPLGMFLAQQRESILSLQGDYVRRLTILEERLSQTMSDVRAVLKVGELTETSAEVREKSSGKGVTFEAAGYEALVQIARSFGDSVEPCGTTTVDGTSRKVGDQIIHICQPGISDLSIVVEQKAGKIGRVPLLRQLKEALEFRSASAAIGLMLRKHLGKKQPVYDPHGPVQVIVGVDWVEGEEEEADWWPLQVAYRVLRGQIIAAKIQKKDSTFDVDQVRAHIASIQSSLDTTSKIKLSATSARKSLDTITETISTLSDSIGRELADMEKAISA